MPAADRLRRKVPAGLAITQPFLRRKQSQKSPKITLKSQFRHPPPQALVIKIWQIEKQPLSLCRNTLIVFNCKVMKYTVFVCLFCFVACGEVRVSEGILEVDYTNPHDIKPSKYIDTVKIVKLETTDESLIGSTVRKVQILNNKICVFDMQTHALLNTEFNTTLTFGGRFTMYTVRCSPRTWCDVHHVRGEVFTMYAVRGVRPLYYRIEC
jgi:hypothetical protein